MKWGIKKLELKANEPEEKDFYRIIPYPSLEMPQEYRNLVIAPFLNSLRYGNDLFKLIDKDSYYLTYPKYIELLLQKTKTLKLNSQSLMTKQFLDGV